MSCSQTDLSWVVVLIVVGVAGQVFGVLWTARDVHLTRRELARRSVAPVIVRQRGMQDGVLGFGEDPDTRMVQETVNRAVEDINRRVSELITGTLKLRPWSVAVIAGGMIVTLAGSLVWLLAPIQCSGAAPI